MNSDEILKETIETHKKMCVDSGIVPEDKIPWNVAFENYNPRDVKLEPAFEGQPFTEEPQEYKTKDFSKLKEIYGDFEFNSEGKPINPNGRTGKYNRGKLAKWGPNPAADPVVYFKNNNDEYFVLLIIRADDGTWALPGGMVDPGEKFSQTAQRELEEETGLSIDMKESEKIYEGYVCSVRNTDNAWIVTSVYSLNITSELKEELQEKIKQHDTDEVLGKMFVKINTGLIEKMGGSHALFVKILCDNKGIEIPKEEVKILHS